MLGPELLLIPELQLKNALVARYIKDLKLCLPNSSKDLPSHLKKILPNTSRQFIEWLVGEKKITCNFFLTPCEDKQVCLPFGFADGLLKTKGIRQFSTKRNCINNDLVV